MKTAAGKTTINHWHSEVGTDMVASPTLKLVTDIGRKTCFIGAVAVLLMHPAIDSKMGLLFGDTSSNELDADTQLELLELWAFGSLVSVNDSYGLYGDATYASHQFALESLAGHVPYLNIEEGAETGMRLVKQPTRQEESKTRRIDENSSCLSNVVKQDVGAFAHSAGLERFD